MRKISFIITNRNLKTTSFSFFIADLNLPLAIGFLPLILSQYVFARKDIAQKLLLF